MLEISCDESGYTGPQLLTNEQQYFVFSSVSISDNDARLLIQKARDKYHVQMPEFKTSQLMKSKNGLKIILYLFEEILERFVVTIHNKQLALCGWIFEYIFEPVFKEKTRFLYKINFHRFISMFTYVMLTNENQGIATDIITQFQKYMRTFDKKDAPLLFTKSSILQNSKNEHPFNLVVDFANGYRDIILADNSNLKKNTVDCGKWLLELSISSLWSHLNYWGKQNKLLKVKCDNSKPLEEMFDAFSGDENDPGIKRARDMLEYNKPLGWKLVGPVSFVNSKEYPAVQIADVIAGIAYRLMNNQKNIDILIPIREKLFSHLLDSILPNLETIDLDQQEASLNYLLLYELAERSKQGKNPHLNLEEFYRVAKHNWHLSPF